MEFKDFKDNPNDLIGQYVLWTSGSIHTPSRSISKIIKITSTSFKIEGSENSFRIDSGELKGGDRGRASWGYNNYCELLTSEEASQLSHKWKEKKAKKVLIASIQNYFNDPNNFDKISLEQLGQIDKILPNK